MPLDEVRTGDGQHDLLRKILTFDQATFNRLQQILDVEVSLNNQGSVDSTSQTIRSDSTLTSSYVASDAVDLQNFNSLAITARVGTTQATKVANLKFQWSHDGSIWTDEPVKITGSITGTPEGGNHEQHFTIPSNVIDIAMDTVNNGFVARFARTARFFRVLAKSDAVTTGTLSVVATRFNQ